MAKNCSKAKTLRKKAPTDRDARKRSQRAHKQKRNPDGTFAKGFESQKSSKNRPDNKTTATTKKTKAGYTPKMVAVTKVFEFRCSNAVRDKVISAVATNFTWKRLE
ncbi:MAG: hypothetical protein IKP20_04895 [Candidatus Methanomethylophilaceae archaeon]|nr:hypothetical protein [Candidatus Methanomethylophilaceae archaeon]